MDSFLRHDPIKSKYSHVGDREYEPPTPCESGISTWGLESHISDGDNVAHGGDRRRHLAGRGNADDTHLIGEDSGDEGKGSARSSVSESRVEHGVIEGKSSRTSASHAYPPPTSSSGSSRKNSPALGPSFVPSGN